MNSCCNAALATVENPSCNLQCVLEIMYLDGLEEVVKGGELFQERHQSAIAKLEPYIK